MYYIDGSVPIKKRNKIIEEFKNLKTEYSKLLILSIEVGGLGLDLKGTNRVVFLERTWSPTKDYQCYMRVYGFDPKKGIEVYFLNYEDEARLHVNKRKQILNKI